MPLDYAVGILDFKLLCRDDRQADSAAAAAPASSEASASAAATIASATAVVAEHTTPEEEQPEEHLRPEFRKLDEGIGGLVDDPELRPALALLKSAVERLKLAVAHANVGDDLLEAKDLAVDALQTGGYPRLKVDAIKVALVAQILHFLNAPAENLQRKLRAVQSTRRSCLLLLKKMNELRAVRRLAEAAAEAEAEAEAENAGDQRDADGNAIAVAIAADQSSDAAAPVTLNEVFAANIQTAAFLRLVQNKILADAADGIRNREASDAAILGEIVGGVVVPPEMRTKEGPKPLVAVMASVFRASKDDDLRLLIELDADDLIDGFCATADEAYWRHATLACDAIGVSLRKKATKKLAPRLGELMDSLLTTGSMDCLRSASKIASITGFLPPMDKESLTKFQSLVHRKLSLYDETLDCGLLRDVAEFVSTTGFVQLLESCRPECGAVASARDAELCRCSSQSAQDLRAANAFNEKSVYPWISEKIAKDAAAAADAAAVDEWIERAFVEQKNITFLALQAPSLQECAPTLFSMFGTNDAADAGDADWTPVIEAASTSGWKGGDWRVFAVDVVGEFKRFRVCVGRNGGGEKVSIKGIKMFQ